MKYLLLLLSILTFALAGQTQPLFTYGNHSVSADEFIKAYQKNKTTDDTGKAALKNYLNLYTIFKLKVQDAKDHRIDTLPALQADLLNFKMQLENSYLYDRKEMALLVQQAEERGKKDIHVISFRLSPEGRPDSSALVRQSDRLYASLLAGKKLSESDASDDHVALHQEDLGFVTVFTLPWELENIVYGLRPGEYSKPFWYGDDRYIFFNQSQRPSVGKIKLAQILLVPAPDDPSGEKAKHLADSLYRLLKNGADFGQLVKLYSNDRTTFYHEGEMAEFGVGKYTPDFEEHAFTLKKDGEISQPFRTAFGYHILKRISATPVPQKMNEEYAYQIKQEILKDARGDLARQKLLDSARLKTGFSIVPVNREDLYKITDTSLIENRYMAVGLLNPHSILFTFKDGSAATVNDWDQFVRNYGKIWNTEFHETYKKLWPEFEKGAIMANFKKHLEQFDADYAAQVNEFEEGNMLFEMMQRKVWQEASQDSAGLAKVYQERKKNYTWPRSADAILYSCSNESVARELSNKLTTLNWRDALKKFAGTVQADSGRYRINQLPAPFRSAKKDLRSVLMKSPDGTVLLVKVIKWYPANIPMTFDEARGQVIEDYQKQLEAEWVRQLKEKYPVVINQAVWEAVEKRAR